MSTDQTVVHELLVSEEAFSVIAEAIRILSVKTLKFQKLRDVVKHCLDSNPTFSSDAASLYVEDMPFDGRVRIYLRLDHQANGRLEQLRSDLCERIGDHCGVREAVVFSAFAICRPELFSCQPPSS